MTADHPVEQSASDTACRDSERQARIDQQLRLLASRNPRLRTEAAQRLGQLRAHPAALLTALEDKNSFVRSAAATALGYAAGDMRAEVIDALQAAIDDPNDYVTSAAIRALGRLQASEARDQIIPFLDDQNQVIVSATILALGQLGALDLAGRLAGFLHADNVHVQLAAVRAIGLLHYTSAGPQLLALLETRLSTPGRSVTSKLPKTLIETLARLQVQEAIPCLTRIAQNEVGLRSTAVQALINLGAETVSSELAHMFADPSSALREALIEMMRHSDYRPALPAIRPLLRDPKMPIRQAALGVIRDWHDLASVEQVRWMCYHDSSPHLRPRALATLTHLLGDRALPDLLALAHDLNTAVRRAVVDNLAQMPVLPSEAVTTLQHLSGDTDPAVAGAAHQMLAEHRFTPANGHGPLPASTPRLPLPPDLQADARQLLSQLERWQAGLAAYAGPGQLDRVAALDAALTTLIVTLREAGRDSPE